MSDFGKDINVPNKDIVYRQDVEDVLQNALPSRGMWEIEGDVVKNTICETVADLMMDLGKLPSAQPEERTDKRTKIHTCDLQPTCNQLATDTISRQAAIDFIDAGHLVNPNEPRWSDNEVVNFLKSRPSAQPEPLTEIDTVKWEDVVDILHRIMQGRSESEENLIGDIVSQVDLLPSAQPYTDDEIQKIQDLEQAQLDKMYELGKQTAQAEIIHCRECKHWKTDHPTANGYHCCHRIHNVFSMREDDFCSRAERRKK